MKQMKEQLEMMRHNVTPSQFLSAVRAAIRSKGLTGICPEDLSLNYWKAGNDLNFDNKYSDPANDPCMSERSVSRPYEMQTYIRNWDGTVYNLIAEFMFDDEKRGSGYFYFVNTWNQEEQKTPEAIPAETIKEEEEKKTMKKQYHIHKAKEHKEQYTPETVRTLAEAVAEARKLRRDGAQMNVSISEGNVKMGAVKSVSVMPFVTCPACTRKTCARDCYAARMALIGPHAGNVRRAWAKNTVLAIDSPDQYWPAVRKAAGKEKHFRFHVGGDIINRSYLIGMIETAEACPETHFLAFTKRHALINEYCDANGGRAAIPANLQIVFSCWEGIETINPYAFPETDVIMPGSPDPSDGMVCGGNCETCINNGVGCWDLRAGEKLYFYLH